MSYLPNDHLEAQAAQALEAARAAIVEGLRLIEDQEDGPFTMRCQIKAIDERVDDIERQVSRLTCALEGWSKVATRLESQRDEALRQRDLLIALIERLHDS